MACRAEIKGGTLCQPKKRRSAYKIRKGPGIDEDAFDP
jgi:hypothetical protein